MGISTIGLDLAKSVFQVHAINDAGEVVVRKALRRSQVLPFFAKLPSCLVGMEACGTSHHWARELIKLGHEVRLMPPAYVKPYVKRGKTDANDAEAICEAVTRPTMRFVPVKSPEQQAALALHRTRDLLVKQRTQLVNMIRGLLAEFGIEMARGLHHALALAKQLTEGRAADVPELAQRVVASLAQQIGAPAGTAGAAREGASRMASLERAVAAPGDDPRRRSHGGDGACRIGERARALPLWPAVCGVTRPYAAAELERRQGEDGADLEDGRSLSQAPAGGRHDLAHQAREDRARLGRSAHPGVARATSGTRGHGSGCEPDGAGCLGDHDQGRELPQARHGGRVTQ